MKRIALALLLLGCSSPTEPSPPSMAGTWALWTNFAGRERASGAPTWRLLTCSGGVTMTLADNAGTLTGGITAGSLACAFDNGPVQPIGWVGPVTGTRAADSVAFTDGYCVYTGAIARASLAGGTLSCMMDDGTTQLDTKGIWEATR